MNSKQKGILHFLIFKKPDVREYTGICYELAIVFEGKNPELLHKQLTEASREYVRVVIEKSMSDKLLNQANKLPEHYVALFKDFEQLYTIHKKDNKSPLTEAIDSVLDARAFVERVPTTIASK